MSGSENYKAVAKSIEDYLATKLATEIDKARPGEEIVKYVQGLTEESEPKFKLAESTIWNYLSTAALKDTESRIRSTGNKRGYFLDTTPSIADNRQEELITEVEPVTGQKTKIAESDLYPLIVSWLETKGFSSKDVSTLKSGGPWGNPDVIGALRTEIFGAVEIEVVSCEVKLDESNWQRFIFEAISHKRFSNRSWYCIRTKSDDSPLPKGIEYYAERYKVGIVQIVLSDDELVQLKESTKPVSDFIDQVIERIPALHETVPLREIADVLTRTGYENSLHAE